MLRRRLIISLLLALAHIATGQGQSLNAHDGSTAAPRLMLVQAMWGLIGYPSKESEWTIEEKLARIKGAGFDAADTNVPKTPEEEQRWLALAAKNGLALGLQTSIGKLEDLDTPLATAKRMKSPYLDVHVGNYYTPEKEATDLLKAMVERCKKEGMPMMVQTHRGRVTQDLFRTLAYTRAIPELRFCLDLSHFFVGGEVGSRLSPQAAALFDELLKRAPMLDGRVSNGEQVQIDMGAGADNTYAKYFAELWKRAMLHWLKGAKPGDVFIFRVELGPPNYSIRDLTGKEISDRWQQAKAMKAVVEKIWNEAVEETGVGALRHVR